LICFTREGLEARLALIFHKAADSLKKGCCANLLLLLAFFFVFFVSFDKEGCSLQNLWNLQSATVRRTQGRRRIDRTVKGRARLSAGRRPRGAKREAADPRGAIQLAEGMKNK
jgi:hypothetical protein